MLSSSLDLVAAATKGLELICHLDDRCPRRVTGDLTRLRQILVNLLSNAVKFTKSGDILVTVTTTDEAPDGLRLQVAVADSGIGILAAAMDRLFRSFSQVDASTTRVNGGTRLGLAISRRLIEAMGGDLTVESTPGVGSTFSFSVVVTRCADPPELPPSSPPLPALAGKRVLVVDDSETNRRILRLQLERWGMHCSDASDPAGAIILVGGAGDEIAGAG